MCTRLILYDRIQKQMMLDMAGVSSAKPSLDYTSNWASSRGSLIMKINGLRRQLVLQYGKFPKGWFLCILSTSMVAGMMK